MMREATVRQGKEDEATISAGLQQSSPGIVEYMGGEGAAPYAAPPYNRGSPTWVAPGGVGLTSSSFSSRQESTAADQRIVVSAAEYSPRTTLSLSDPHLHQPLACLPTTRKQPNV